MPRFPRAIAWCLAAGVLLAAAAPAQAWPFRHRHRGFWPVWPYYPYSTYIYSRFPREDVRCLEQRYLEKRYRAKGEGERNPAASKRLADDCERKEGTPGR